MTALANYPKTFLGTVVSPTKICLQFGEVESKVRESDKDIFAVGCQMPVIEKLQSQLIEAYIQYGRHNSEVYRQNYTKDFLDFLLKTQAQLNNAIDKLKDRHAQT